MIVRCTSSTVVLGVLLGYPALAAQAFFADAGPPNVTLDKATVIGKTDGTTVQYLGLQYTQPPVGDLRLRIPLPNKPYSGTINATTFGNRCLQQTYVPPTLPDGVPAAVNEYFSSFTVPVDVPMDEDCLNLNVIVPANVTSDAKLPVAVWIYGGAFQVGYNGMLPGEVVVARSVEIGHPLIYVAMNYRLSAFGFLGGKEVKEAGVGNLGLHDQREALRWVQKYISAFGGDPSKVTIWGESAGSMSVALQMLADNGNTHGLFRAGFMESGSLVSNGYIDNDFLQSTYDSFVDDCGCAGAKDTLDCLRKAPVESLTAAINRTETAFGYEQLSIPWLPRADGVFLADLSTHQVARGAVARVPFVNGNDMDEGTIFSFGTLNVTTDADFLEYIATEVFRDTPRDDLEKVLELYPSDPAAGSPFDTGDDFAYTPQYKRMAAFEGDLYMHGPRRFLLSHLADRQPVYSYLYNKNRVDGLGAPHGAELTDVYGRDVMGDYLIRFVSTLDPNGDGAVQWPRYTSAAPQLLTFFDGDVPPSLTPDTFRVPQTESLTKLALAHPL